MKSKKGKSSSSNKSDEHRTSALSFFKNRLFSSHETSPSSSATESSTSTSSSRPISRRSPISIDIPKSAQTTDWSTSADRPISKSFEEPMHLEVSRSISNSSSNSSNTVRKNPRPVSMMGLRRITTGGSDSPATSPTVVKRRRTPDHDGKDRSSLIIIKEGFLYKKADFRAFHKAHNHRGWKLYRIVLRGHKLYLYKMSSESPLRSLVPSPKHHRQIQQHQTSLFLQQQQQQKRRQQQQEQEDSIIIHHPADRFHDEQLRRSYIYGAKFKDGDKHVDLLIFAEQIVVGTYVGQQQWREECRIPLDHLHVVKCDNKLIFIIENESKERVFTSFSNEVQLAWINAFESQAGLPAVKVSKEGDELQSPSDDTRLHVTSDTDGRRIVLGGTISALIHELLTSEKLDEEYMNAFLLTFPMFTSSGTICNILQAYISHTPQVGGRIIDLVQLYCTHFMQDIVGDVANGLILLMESLEENEHTNDQLRDESISTKELLLATVRRNGDEAGGGNVLEASTDATAPPVTIDDDDYYYYGGGVKKSNTVEDIPGFEKRTASLNRRRPASVNLSNMLITGLTPALFLTIDPESFAEQVYWFHRSQQRQYESTLMNPLTYVPRPQTSPQVVNSLVFTTASPHFLTKLIRNHILIESQQGDITGLGTENMTLTRSMLLEHWIRVGIALTKLGDMTGWCAVATAICSLGVIRLKESWKAVDRTLVATVTQQWVGMLAEYGLFAQDMWLEGWEKTVAVDEFARIMDPPRLTEQEGIPFFGTLRQAVDRLRKHLKNEYDDEQDTINFSKYWRIYHVVRQGLDTWTVINHDRREKQDQGEQARARSFKVVGPLQAFFEHSVNDFISVPHDFKYLQECSLACEPRIFGQSYDRHRKFDSLHGIDVAPPSSATLSFPEILEGYTLFQQQQHYQQQQQQALDPLLSASPRSQQNLRKKGSSHSIKSDVIVAPSKPMSPTSTPQRPALHDHARSSPRVTRRKMFRRRTYSFPPGGAGSITSSSVGTDLDTINSNNSNTKKSEEYSDSYLDSLHSKTWLGSLISHRHGSYSAKAILDAVQLRKDKGMNDSTLVVEGGDLILKASTLVQADDSVTKKPLKKSISSGFLVLADKGSSGIRSRSGTINSMTARKSEEFQKKEENAPENGIGHINSNNNNDTKKSTPVFVNVKAGRLERLVEVLVDGVSRYDKDMREQWHLSSQFLDREFNPQHLALDEEEYINAFFVTYRSFCSVVELLELLRDMFTGAVSAGRLAKQRKTSALESVFQPSTMAADTVTATTGIMNDDRYTGPNFDWRVVVSIQRRVVSLMLHWMEEHFYDFVDEIEILNHIGRFLQRAQDALEAWRTTVKKSTTMTANDQRTSLTAAKHIDRQLEELRKQFIYKILSPSYDLKAIDYDTGCSRNIDELYKQLMSGTQGFRTAITYGARKSMAFSLSTLPLDNERNINLVDQQSASILLKQANQCVHQLFASVTLQDWIQTFDVFEAQSSDLYAWLPSHKASQTPPMSMTLSPVEDGPTAQPTDYHIPHDDIMISDVFTAIEGARRSVVSPSAFSADDLLLAFPSSIQYLYCMHFIIRSWVIHEITSHSIDFQTRVQRIDKFLQMVVISKSATERMVLFPELRDVEDRPRRVPGFVEYAIASALISPEVRLFSKAWMYVTRLYGPEQPQPQQPETLEWLLSHVQRSIHNNSNNIGNKKSDSMVLLVPSVGWIFDRMLELCAAVPDTYNHLEHMINFDKRRYVFHFLQLIMNAQMDIEEQQQQHQDNDDGTTTTTKRNEERHLSFIICPQMNKSTWRDFKDYANKENRQGGSGGSGGGTSISSIRDTSVKGQQGVFSKLVGEQQEKLKRDIKERDRIDKEWRDLQHKLQKRQNEQARYIEKQERKSHKHSHSNQFHHHQQHLPKLNSLLRGLRPTSLSTSSSSTSNASSIATTSPTDPAGSVQFQTAKASTVINLIHSTTSVASAYTKRDHVFRIVTEEGGQSLFQATNREDMLDWMQQINNAAREGALKRRSVLASDEQRNSRFYDEDPTRRETSDAAANTQQLNTRKSVYGVELVILMDDGSVPLLVEKCIAEIEKRGLEEVGIYRTAGTGSVVEQLKSAFNSDMSKVDLSDPQWADINVVADALKQFLRNIPGSLMTHIYYDEFIIAAASEDHDQRVYLIKQVIQKLPDPNYTLLKRLIEHFVIVTDFEATNHMYATNLAIVFGPTLLQPAPGPASFATTMSNLGHHQTIVKYLILHFHYFFDIEEVEEIINDDD